MKVLLIAYACHPTRGSESHVGWSAAMNLALHHEVWVLTHSENRQDIEAYQKAGQIPGGPHFLYHGSAFDWHPNRLLARLQSWREYQRWLRGLHPAALQYHERIGFDLTHHLSYATWRLPSPLWRLPIPSVWGPVGGVATYPTHLLPRLSPSALAFELARNVSTFFGKLNPALRLCLQHSSAIIASNQETLDFFRNLRGHDRGLHLLSAASFTEERLKFFGGDSPQPKPEGTLRIFSGGNLIGSKGLIFALMALKLLKDQGIPFRFTVASNGPEVPHLKAKAKAWGLMEEIVFNDGYRGNAYAQALQESHIFLLPSFRENAPVTIMEAMLARCVPVVVKASAQGEIVSEDCGFAVKVGSAREISRALARAIETLHHDRSLLNRMGQAAHERICSGYSQDHYLKKILALYNTLLGPDRDTAVKASEQYTKSQAPGRPSIRE